MKGPLLGDIAVVVGTVAIVSALIAYDLYRAGLLEKVASIVLTGG